MASTSNQLLDGEKKQTFEQTIYGVKAIEFEGRNTQIIIQNENGPSPLIAICNMLLLGNKSGLSERTTHVSKRELLNLVNRSLLDSISYDENISRNLENVKDAISSLPGLATGLTVNVKFTRIDGIELPEEGAVFGLLGIPLYHAWLVHPWDSETSKAIGSKSYNDLLALQNRSILTVTADPTSSTKGNEGEVGITAREGELIRNFLNDNATQLTKYGFFCLKEELKDGELCVFFRNDHFSTMYKFEGALYMLVTDVGYVNQPGVVWEKLTEVNGEKMFVNNNFKHYKEKNVGYVDRIDYTAAQPSTNTSTNLSSDPQHTKAFDQLVLEGKKQQLVKAIEFLERKHQELDRKDSQKCEENVKVIADREISRNTCRKASMKDKKRLKEKCGLMRLCKFIFTVKKNRML